MMLSGFNQIQAYIGIVPQQIVTNPLVKTANPHRLSITDYDSPGLFSITYDLLKYSFTVDSTLTYYQGKCAAKAPFFARPVVLTFADYRSQRLQDDIKNQWAQETAKKVLKATAAAGGGALEIEIPWRVKSKTFQRIFGGDRVGLKVTGDITINGKLRRQKTSQTYTTQNDASNYTFQIDQTQRFNIEGKVGDKVSVFIDQDSERMFDFENSLKLEYTGHEDEIIQKIEAGNISLSLTGATLATFSSSNKGLFGLKTESRFGPLKLTTIASVEKGQKDKKSLKGGAEEQTIEIQSTAIVRNKYFFIGDGYRENFRHFDQNMDHYIISGLADSIHAIRVFRSTTALVANADNGYRPGWAMYNPIRENMPDSVSANTDERNNVFSLFQLLEENTDYYVDRRLGYIRMNYPLSSEQILGVSYIVTGDTIGDYILPDSIAQNILLKLIRPANPQPTDSTWKYEFKNVYSLGASNVEDEGFDFDIYQDLNTASVDPNTQSVNGVTKTYLEIFGLDQRGNSVGTPPDGVMDLSPSLISLPYGEVYFPGLRPFDPDPAKGGGYYIEDSLVIPPLDSTTLMRSLYDSSNVYNTVSRYYFKVKYANVSASYSLGFNVLEGSEEVYLNGKKLTKGVGYRIDYMTGNLTILDQAASQPSANVEVLWEKGEIFQLDKTTLLGVRGEYELWNQESFIGGTALYLNEKPMEERVKLGNEPIRNFIIDANTRIVYKPEFLTNALDFLPLIEADQPSEIRFEGEIARLFPNPNPLNNEATGDNNGVAYVDDFESIKRVTSLGVMRKNWTISSVPPGVLPMLSNTIERNYYRGDLIWYNPYDQVPITSIWEREVNTQVQSNVHVLDMVFEPDTSSAIPIEGSWGGVMRGLSAGFADQSKSKYLEVWLNLDEGEACTLYVDLGQVSEDAIPDVDLNTEDEFFAGNSFGNGILDEGEDIGLDGMADTDSSAQAAGGDFWDLDDDGAKGPFEPFSNDNYSYSISNKNDYSHINGTENNELDGMERRPDTEDLDNNNAIDLSENFFRCAIPLPLEQGDVYWGSDGVGQWRLARVPLDEAEKIGSSASWSLIEYARIWIAGAAEPVKIRIATMELVGNEWEEVITTDAVGVSHEKTKISVINTYDNADIYEQPPGVSGIRDPITNILAREQSLVVEVVDMHKDDIAMVQKTFFNTQDFLKYNTLKMFVYANQGQTTVMSDSSMRVFFRFGSDTSHNYYEIYQYIQVVPNTGWAPKNQIEIDLTEIPRLKLDRDQLLLNPNYITDTKIAYKIVGEDTSVYAYRIIDGDSLVVMGEPSLSQIKQLTIGIDYRGEKRHLTEDDNIELWFDELRLSEVKKEPGTAYRTTADIKFSDLAAVNLGYNEKDDSYHSLNGRMDNPGQARSESQQTVSGNIKIDKFLPPSWGLQLPLNGNYSNTVYVPKYLTQSDIELDQNNQSEVELVQDLSRTKGWGINFSRSGAAGGKILEYTVNKLTSNYSYAETYSTNPTSEYSQTKRNNGQVRYSLTIPAGTWAFGLMNWSRNIPLLKKLKDTKFQPMLTKVDLTVSGNESVTNSLTRTQYYQRSENADLTRSFGTGWKPFNSMNFNLDRTHRSDMVGYEWTDVFDGVFGLENSVNQNFSASYAPTIFKWLTHDVNYSSNYTWSWGSGYSENGKSIHSRNSISFSSTLKTSQLFKSKTAKSKPKLTPPPKSTEPDSLKIEDKEKKPQLPSFPNPIKVFKTFVTNLKDIRFDYSHNRDLSTPGVIGQAGWLYQFGLAKNPEVGQISTISTGSESYTDNYQARSGINITKNLKTSFDYSFKNTENYGNTTNGNYSQSEFFLVKKNGAVTALPFVNLNTTLTGLEKTPLFEKYAQSVSLESNYTGKTATDWTTSKSNIIKNTYDRNFSPLLGVNISWKGGISSNIKYKKTFTLTDNVVSDQKTRNYSTTYELTGSYNRKTGFKIPIPVWPFKNKRFENNTTFSMVFTLTTRKKDEMTGDTGTFNERERNMQWSFSPKVDYQFSSTVTGGIHYEMGATNDKYSGKSSYNEFGFNVKITIRGK